MTDINTVQLDQVTADRLAEVQAQLVTAYWGPCATPDTFRSPTPSTCAPSSRCGISATR